MDQCARLLVAALGFAGCSMPSYDRAPFGAALLARRCHPGSAGAITVDSDFRDLGRRLMSIVHVLGRVVLAVAFISGSCGDRFPGSEGMECATPTPTSEVDGEAGETLGQASLELISELDVTFPIPLQSHLLRTLSPQGPSLIAIRRIPHVPKPSVSL